MELAPIISPDPPERVRSIVGREGLKDRRADLEFGSILFGSILFGSIRTQQRGACYKYGSGLSSC